MTSGSAKIHREDPFLRVVIDRPDADNAIDTALVRRLHHALDVAERAPECRAIVVQGRPGSFCTGLDLGTMAEANRHTAPTPGVGREYFTLLRRMSSSSRVVITAVDGRAMGGGLGLVAASDWVLATATSQFSLPEALWGLLPCCVLPFLMRRVGFQPAYALTLSTRPMGIEAALRCGLVDEQADALDVAIRQLGIRLRRLEPTTVGDLKRYFNRLWEITDSVEAAAIGELDRLMSSPTIQHNIEAFARDRRFPWE